LLAIECSTKPEYVANQQIIGYLYQFNGNAQKAYAIKSGKDVIRLELPETTRLMFLPTTYLSDGYTLTLGYTNVGAVIDGSNSVSVPESLLALPIRVTGLETDVENINTILGTYGGNSADSWAEILDKPLSFAPSNHDHSIGDVTNLSMLIGSLVNADSDLDNRINEHIHSISNIDLLQINLDDLDSRLDTLEAVTPSTSASQNYISLSTDTLLESNKNYLSISVDLAHTLPSSPAIGDVINLGTANLSAKVYQNTGQSILNLSTQTPVGALTGLVLKAFSSIQLIYVSTGLWVTGYRSRLINNYVPITIESTTTPKAYTPSIFGSTTLAYGTVPAMINNNQLAADDYANNGLLANTNVVRVLIQFPQSTRLESFDFYGGQGNRPPNVVNDEYKVEGIKVYSGNTLANLIGTFNPTNINGSKQSFAVDTSGAAYSAYIFEFTRQIDGVGILELDLFGKSQMGGEIVAI
jgi:hypothetical protein